VSLCSHSKAHSSILLDATAGWAIPAASVSHDQDPSQLMVCASDMAYAVVLSNACRAQVQTEVRRSVGRHTAKEWRCHKLPPKRRLHCCQSTCTLRVC
jgi:hypothetical protein